MLGDVGMLECWNVGRLGDWEIGRLEKWVEVGNCGSKWDKVGKELMKTFMSEYIHAKLSLC